MELTADMIFLLGLLGFTIFLFVFEIFRVDVSAILVLIILGISGLVGKDDLFSGFSENAVISVIAVMILGKGLDRVGVIKKLAEFILTIGGTTKKRIIPIVSGTVGIISSFMQNIGAAALFLPVMSKISSKTKIPLSQLLMPMGFCAIIGGTVTMIGSSPLIMLNSLISAYTPEGSEVVEFGIFDVMPIGITLMIVGIMYFMIFGDAVLPAETEKTPDKNPLHYFSKHFGIPGRIFELRVRQKSPLMGQTIADLHLLEDSPIIVAMHDSKTYIRFQPSEKKQIRPGASLAVMGDHDFVAAFAEKYHLEMRESLQIFRSAFDSTNSGVAEFVIPHTSSVIGKTLPEWKLPTNVSFSILQLIRQGEKIRTSALGKEKFYAGDTLIVHSSWENIRKIDESSDIVVVTEYPAEEDTDESKMPIAIFFFALAMFLAVLGGKEFLGISIPKFPLSLSLFIGAMGMIFGKVLTIDKAYKAVDWKTIFLLASLFPLGLAMKESGTAGWIAGSIEPLLRTLPILGVAFIIAILTTFFTLLMSNVGATILLVPIAMNLAHQLGANPAAFALLVGIGASNSFLIPTHQVNALLMGPGGYSVKDFLKAGGIMTLLFLGVSVGIIYILFL